MGTYLFGSPCSITFETGFLQKPYEHVTSKAKEGQGDCISFFEEMILFTVFSCPCLCSKGSSRHYWAILTWRTWHPKSKICDEKAKMQMKKSNNELKNVLVMKLNTQSIKIYKTTLHSSNLFLAESFKVVRHRTNYIIPAILCFLRFLWMAKSQPFIV